MDNIELVGMTADDVPIVAEVAALALGPTPYMSALSSGMSDPESRMTRVFSAIFTRSPETVMVAKEGDAIVGMMRTVDWPRCQPTPVERLAMLPSMFWVLRSNLLRVMRGRAAWANRDPKKAHRHLDPLAVRPGHQGQGIGTKLLEVLSDQADRDSMPCYLETDREQTRRLYERFGFEVVDEAEVMGVPCYFMWRDPH